MKLDYREHCLKILIYSRVVLVVWKPMEIVAEKFSRLKALLSGIHQMSFSYL